MHTLLIGCAFLVAAPNIKQQPKVELPKGEWIAEKIEQNGSDRLTGPSSFQFTEDKAILTMSGVTTKIPTSFDASTKIAQINFYSNSKEGMMPGIYKIEGEILTICLTGMRNGIRPTEFNSNGEQTVLWVLKRVRK